MNLIQHASVWLGGADTVDLPMHQVTQEGSLLVAVVGGTADRIGALGTVTDDAGNVYQARRVSNVDSVHVGVFYAAFATGGAGNFHYTWPAAGIVPIETWITLLEYSGAEKETPAGVAQSGGSNPPDTPYFTNTTLPPIFGRGMVVAAASAYRNTSVPDPGTDYTLEEHLEAADNTAFMVADKPLSDKSPQSCTFAGVDASPYAAVIVVFYDPIPRKVKTATSVACVVTVGVSAAPVSSGGVTATAKTIVTVSDQL